MFAFVRALHARISDHVRSQKRAERKEIITEIVETELKYGRDLQIILEEFHRPMLRAGLLTSEQLSAIFLNVEELLEHNLALAEKLKDSVEFAQVEDHRFSRLAEAIGKAARLRDMVKCLLSQMRRNPGTRISWRWTWARYSSSLRECSMHSRATARVRAAPVCCCRISRRRRSCCASSSGYPRWRTRSCVGWIWTPSWW